MKPVINVHVSIEVLPDQVEAFIAATSQNARSSRQEPGVIRFDLLRLAESATQFLLVEVYQDAQAVAAHKETDHYALWRDTVAPMMARPRTSQKLVSMDSPDGERA